VARNQQNVLFGTKSEVKSRLLVGFLLLTLGLAVVLAIQVHAAVKSHRATAESVLREYAGFAAFHYARQVKPAIYEAVSEELSGAPRLRFVNGRLPSPEALVMSSHRRAARETHCPGCGFVKNVDAYFAADLVRDTVLATTSEMPFAVQRMVRDTLGRMRGPRGRAVHNYGAVFRTVENNPVAVGYFIQFDSTGTPLYAFGFTTTPEAFRTILSRIYMHSAMLPTTLTRGAPNDSILAVEVTDADGTTLYKSPRVYQSSFTARDTTYQVAGHLRINTTLRPSTADMLLIGGLPQSRLPILLALLVTTTLLIGASLLQLRREGELAALRSNFVSSVSHELRTPLAQIRMFAETLHLKRVRSEDERDRYIEIIDQESRRLAHLVDNVLVFSRAERRQVKLRPETVSLCDVVNNVREMFMPLANDRGVALEVEAEDDATVRADRSALQQVLLNLWDNAVKYGPKGQTVRTTIAADNGIGRLTVSDEGPGIPAGHHARVFEPFWRLPRDSDSAVAGSGIGLAVVQELIVQQGGRVWVEDAPSGGARFIVELPSAAPKPKTARHATV
jgi:signal transduction histidine kinase